MGRSGITVGDILINLEESLYKEAENRKGGWRGFRDFKLHSRKDLNHNITEFNFMPTDGYMAGFDFVPGQLISIKQKVGDGISPRHYTITSKPGENYLQCSVKLVHGGIMSNFIHDLKVGDVIKTTPPFGAFHLADNKKPNVLISAGIGVTPMKAFSTVGNVKLAVHVDSNKDSHVYHDIKNVAQEYECIYTERMPVAEQKAVLRIIDLCSKHKKDECNYYICG
eukprot:UN29137